MIMKKIFSLWMLLAAVLLGACEESLDDLTGRYDFDRYRFTGGYGAVDR